jgi:hypothetical protein
MQHYRVYVIGEVRSGSKGDMAAQRRYVRFTLRQPTSPSRRKDRFEDLDREDARMMPNLGYRLRRALSHQLHRARLGCRMFGGYPLG